MKIRQAAIPFLLRFFLLLLFMQALIQTHAQDTDNTFDQVYGFDPLLYNGKVYYFFPRPGTGGSQYLLDEFDPGGAVQVRGISYTGLSLNYDLFNQQLIYKYKNSAGSNSLLVISEAWLGTFDLGDRHFSLIPDADTVRRIYQVLGKGSEKVLYSLTKDLLLDNFKNGGMHYFSDTRREMFVLKGGEIIGFKNNRSFIKAFEPARQELIKKYMHKYKVKVKTATYQSITDLINYCSSLTKS